MGAKNSTEAHRNNKNDEFFDDDIMHDSSLSSLENAEVNLTDSEDKWIKANVVVENGKVRLFEVNNVRPSLAHDDSTKALTKLRSGRHLMNMGSNASIADKPNCIAEIILAEKPSLRIEEAADEIWELIVTGDAKKIRIRAVDEEEASKWMKLIRYEIMRSLDSKGLFFSSGITNIYCKYI